MVLMLFIRQSNGYYHVSDAYGNHMSYMGHSKREVIRKFKNQFGYRYKHGVDIVDYTRM